MDPQRGRGRGGSGNPRTGRTNTPQAHRTPVSHIQIAGRIPMMVNPPGEGEETVFNTGSGSGLAPRFRPGPSVTGRRQVTSGNFRAPESRRMPAMNSRLGSEVASSPRQSQPIAADPSARARAQPQSSVASEDDDDDDDDDDVVDQQPHVTRYDARVVLEAAERLMPGVRAEEMIVMSPNEEDERSFTLSDLMQAYAERCGTNPENMEVMRYDEMTALHAWLGDLLAAYRRQGR